MEKELFGLGRGYLLLVLTLGLSGAMVFTGNISGQEFISSAQWLVPLVIASKEAGKVFTKSKETK